MIQIQYKSNQLVFLVEVLKFLSESIATCFEQKDKERLKHSQQSVLRLLSELTSEADINALRRAQEPQKEPVVPKHKVSLRDLLYFSHCMHRMRSLPLALLLLDHRTPL